VVWFRRYGFLFVPVSIAGGIATLLALGAGVWAFLQVDAGSHSVSDTLYGVVPLWAGALGLWLMVAGLTSPRR
jgi:hypothetical protein